MQIRTPFLWQKPSASAALCICCVGIIYVQSVLYTRMVHINVAHSHLNIKATTRETNTRSQTHELMCGHELCCRHYYHGHKKCAFCARVYVQTGHHMGAWFAAQRFVTACVCACVCSVGR